MIIEGLDSIYNSPFETFIFGCFVGMMKGIIGYIIVKILEKR